MRNLTALATMCLSLCLQGPARSAEIDWARIDAMLGRTAVVADLVHRYGFPRTDLTVTLDGVTIRPTLALGGWVAFRSMGDEATLMGDLVLTGAEVAPVARSLLAGGLEVTAIHNHLLRASPATFYLHVGGHGDPVKLAESLRAALALTGTPLAQPPGPPTPPAVDLNTAQLDEAIGAKGRANGGVYQFSVRRADVVTERAGMIVPDFMGSAHVINFQSTGSGKAAITGDFIVTASEVEPLITALSENGIEVTAIHNHMLFDQPRMFFVHFWANDDAAKLARAVRKALDQTNTP